MSHTSREEHDLEVAVSQLLRAGVLISAALLAIGWALRALQQPAGHVILQAGVRVLMATPILRVLATFVLFLRQRDLGYVVITAVVLAFLAVGVLGGLEL